MKKTLTIILVIALLCVLSVGTTLSYFTDTDGQANTMTVGEVDIIQKINGEDTGSISSALYPYTGDLSDEANQSFDTNKNAVDTNITITLNAGSEAAFVRTIFAFEANGNADAVGDMIHVHYNAADGVWAKIGTDAVEINGAQYYIYSFTYNKAYAEGDTTATSLKQFCLDGSAKNSFSGGSYEILVVSQAVQAQGFGTDIGAAFAAAFPNGTNNANVAGWFDLLFSTNG